MDETLRQHLQALASGDRESNHPIVEAYLRDEHALEIGALLKRISSRRNGSLFLLPSSCLPPLD